MNKNPWVGLQKGNSLSAEQYKGHQLDMQNALHTQPVIRMWRKWVSHVWCLLITGRRKTNFTDPIYYTVKVLIFAVSPNWTNSRVLFSRISYCLKETKKITFRSTSLLADDVLYWQDKTVLRMKCEICSLCFILTVS